MSDDATILARAWTGLIGPPTWGYDAPGTATDVTARLNEIRREPKRVAYALQDAKPKLSELRILIVPGLLTDLLKPLKYLGLSTYLDAQKRAFVGLAADVEQVDINTQDSAARNADVICHAVRESDRQVCLISHSKGGVDVLEFLVRADEGLRRKIACWIAFQAPFAGSPVAQAVADKPLLKLPAETLLIAFCGSPDALHDLTVSRGIPYLREHDSEIKDVSEHIPIIAVAHVDRRRTPLQAAVADVVLDAGRRYSQRCAGPAGIGGAAPFGVRASRPPRSRRRRLGR